MNNTSSSGSSHSGTVERKRMADAIRVLAMDAVEAAKSGHPGMPMGMADAATALFADHLKFDPADPAWPDRDRFVLSAGHGSMLLYALLHLTGYEAMTMDEIRNFRQLGSRTAGHPEYGHAPGIETTTGPLGQGLANAVGMALAERLMAARFGDAVVDHHTYAIAGDGCLMEGISHEAISLAGHLKLGKLIVLFDDNRISIDGPTDLSVSDDQAARFAASGWDTEAVDGQDAAAVSAAIARAKKTDRPSLILCRTTIGYGAPSKAGSAGSHGSPLGAEEIAGARAAYGWKAEPFELPDDVLTAWRTVGAKGAESRAAWAKRRDALPGERKNVFERTIAGRLPEGLDDTIRAYKKSLSEEAPKRATRQSSGETLDVLAEHLPELIGGSADLTGSNNTKAKSQGIVSPEDFSGGYIHYGVREHGMAAAMNGMALHGGLIPYGGTFLIFTDYARPAMRLSALMGIRTIYVMTHDSIGLGEDGPTHQPVEQLASLRTMPNMAVFRPADAVETAECWALALARQDGPSTLALTRQGLPTLRTTHTDENLSARGAYVLVEASGPARVTLYATGSEVSLAVEAQALLEGKGVPTRVVSVPSRELFEAQDESYKAGIVDPNQVRIAVEAAIGFGWERFTGAEGAFVGMTGFGASAPAGDLYRHFGITAEAIAKAARERL
ncbi:MAG: transketolase [Proteobacteria bacterium]|nr:transketolase [Pseudomonadota bacterium]